MDELAASGLVVALLVLAGWRSRFPDEQGRLNQRQLPIRNGPLDELASMPASRFRAVLDYRLQQLHRLQANLHIPEATPD